MKKQNKPQATPSDISLWFDRNEKEILNEIASEDDEIKQAAIEELMELLAYYSKTIHREVLANSIIQAVTPCVLEKGGAAERAKSEKIFWALVEDSTMGPLILERIPEATAKKNLLEEGDSLSLHQDQSLDLSLAGEAAEEQIEDAS